MQYMLYGRCVVLAEAFNKATNLRQPCLCTEMACEVFGLKKIKCKIISIKWSIFVHTPGKERMTYGPHSIRRDLSFCIPVLIRVSCYAHMGLHHDHFHCDTPWLRYANYQWHFEPSAVLLSTQIVRIYEICPWRFFNRCSTYIQELLSKLEFLTAQEQSLTAQKNINKLSIKRKCPQQLHKQQ